MTSLTRLIHELEGGYSGSPWHGPSLQDNLHGVTAAQASKKMGKGHTIWELVLHVAAWRGEVACRLRGQEARTPPEGDFPPAPDAAAATESEWHKAMAWLDDAQQQVVAAVRELRGEDLEKPVLDYRKDAGGRGATREATLLGLVQHDAYHSGQIALLKKC
jgi:uncharacterized damage-inducible protein DinB